MRALLLVLALGAVATTAAAVPLAPSAPAPGRPGIVEADAHFGDAADDTDFLFRLGMMEGHLMVGHELLQAHKAALALPHFGHPVRELYDDISDYLKQKGSPAFDAQLVKLEAAVAAAPESAETETLYQTTIATVHRARDLAPAELRASLPEMVKICSDTIDAASGEYGQSLEHGRVASIVEYHDSRGYLAYVKQQVAELGTAHPDEQSQGILQRFKAILAKAEWIVEPLVPSPAPRASVSQYRAIAAEAAALTK